MGPRYFDISLEGSKIVYLALRTRCLLIAFRPSENWHLFWDFGIWAHLLGSRNLGISFRTSEFGYLVWDLEFCVSRLGISEADWGRETKRASGEKREGDGARTILVIAVLKSMGKCFLSQYYHLPYVILKTMICENLNSVENRGRKNQKSFLSQSFPGNVLTTYSLPLSSMHHAANLSSNLGSRKISKKRRRIKSFCYRAQVWGRKLLLAQTYSGTFWIHTLSLSLCIALRIRREILDPWRFLTREKERALHIVHKFDHLRNLMTEIWGKSAKYVAWTCIFGSVLAFREKEKKLRILRVIAVLMKRISWKKRCFVPLLWGMTTRDAFVNIFVS